MVVECKLFKITFQKGQCLVRFYSVHTWLKVMFYKRVYYDSSQTKKLKIEKDSSLCAS